MVKTPRFHHRGQRFNICSGVKIRQGAQSRGKKEIDESLLIELINKRLTGNEISKHLGISRRTLYNRLNLLNLKLNTDPTFNINAFDNIDNEEKSIYNGNINLKQDTNYVFYRYK